MALTAKELTAIEEQLNCEVTAVKKYRLYAQTCTDKDLAQKLSRIADKHQQHYNRLMGMLQ